MQITRFVSNFIEENCYLLADESTHEAALIDCGAYHEEERQAVGEAIRSRELRLVRHFCTHGHFDHVWGADYIYKEFGIAPELCAEERATYGASREQMQLFLRRALPLELPLVSCWFSGGDTLRFGGTELEVIATPGHTPGGVCFYCKEEGVLFSGDSLFRRSVGRCDLPGGDEPALISSLKEKILTLPDEVKVFPGHGEATTIGEERLYNPCLQ